MMKSKDWVPEAQVVQAAQVLAQVQALPLQAVPALAPAHLRVAPAPALAPVPALVQAQVLAQAPHLHTAPVPAHLRANPTVTTKNMTHTDQ